MIGLSSPAHMPGVRPAGPLVGLRPELDGAAARSRDAIARLLFGADDGPILVGRYRLSHRIASGGMGTVWAAHDPQLGRDVACKLVRGATGSTATGDIAWRDEMRALARVNHPNVLALFDFGISPRDPFTGNVGEPGWFMITELVAGQTLRSWLMQPRTTAAVLTVMTAVGHGLAAAHACGVVHCDVKPDNVLVGNDGRPRVLDFGIARVLDRDATPQTSLVGTPRYMAPEQRMRGPIGPGTDVYAYCLVIAEAFGAQLNRIAPGDPDRAMGVVQLAASMPAALRPWMRRGLATAPQDRPPLGDLLAALERAARPRRRRWLLGAALLTLASAGLGPWGEVDTACSGLANAAGLEDDRRAVLANVRLPTDEAERVDAQLAAFVHSWDEARTIACQTSAPISTGHCLQIDRAELSALVNLVESRSPDRDRLASAVAAIPDPLRCVEGTRRAPAVRVDPGVAIRLAHGRVAARLGEHAAAIAAAEGAIRGVEVDLDAGAASDEHAIRLAEAAAILRDAGEGDRAIEQFERAHLVATTTESWATAAEAATALASAYGFDRRLPRRGEQWAREADIALLRLPAVPPRLAGELQVSRSAIAFGREDYADALARLRDAVTLLGQGDTSATELAGARVNLGRVAGWAGDDVTAIDTLTRARADLEHGLGPRHRNVAVAGILLAEALARAGHDAEAEAGFRDVAQSQAGSGSVEEAYATLGWAQTRGHRDGDPARAIELFERGLALLGALPDPDPRDIANARALLGALLARAGRHDDAEVALRLALGSDAGGELDDPRQALADLAAIRADGTDHASSPDDSNGTDYAPTTERSN